MHTRLTLDGTNSSSLKMVSYRTRKDKLLLSKAKLILRTDKLLEKTETIKNTNNGVFFMLIKLNQNQLKALPADGDFGLIDHSILYHNYKVESTLI